MDETIIIKELEEAAKIIMQHQPTATREQSQASEALFINFRKTKSPYSLCQKILETSTVDLVLFEAAHALKNSLIVEWNYLQDNDKASLRQYLLNYIMHKDLQPFVREKILQVVAIMIKRGSIEDFGLERANIIIEVNKMIMTGDMKQQYLACRILATLMEEYATIVKSDDTGLTFEEHFKVKKQFENVDLRKIFVIILEALEQILKIFDITNVAHTHLSLEFLKIIEYILSWGHVSPLLPKKLIGVFETVYKTEQAPSLRFGIQWESIMLEPKMLELFFNMYWKVREHGDLQPRAMACLVQLSTLNGPIVEKNENKTKNIINYLSHLLPMLQNIQIKDTEVLGFSIIFRKLLLFNPPKDLRKIQPDVLTSMLQIMLTLTCQFADGCVKEEIYSPEETVFVDALENILEAWVSIIIGKEYIPQDLIGPLATQMFNKYVQCHLSPPDGIRGSSNDAPLDIGENEAKDREKYKEQLIIIGLFGREMPGHSLPILAKLLEDKTRRLHGQLQRMFSNMPNCNQASVSDSKVLESLFEDIQWILLISGHVLTIESEGEQPLIPPEIMLYSTQQTNNGVFDINTSLKLLASPTQCVSEIPNADNMSDHVVRLVAGVFRLCEIEKGVIEAKMGNFLSPEVSTTIMWFLAIWSEAYLLPLPQDYSAMSDTLTAAFGNETPGGTWTINFILNKICLNIQHYASETDVLADTTHLFISLVEKKHKCTAVFSSEYFKTIVQLKNTITHPEAKRQLLKGLTITSNFITDKQMQKNFLEEILLPTVSYYRQLIPNINHQSVRVLKSLEIIPILEEMKVCMEGCSVFSATLIFEMLSPIFMDLAPLVDMFYDTNVVIAVLELLHEIVQNSMFVDQSTSNRIHEIFVHVTRAYVKHNANRLSADFTAEEDTLQDLLLVLKVLNQLLMKNLFSLTDVSEQAIDTADVYIFGLTHILPMMSNDLLKYPALCLQYYQTITLFAETKSYAFFALNDELLKRIFYSIELGLTSFGTEVQGLCFDFVQIIANAIYYDQNKESLIYRTFVAFLKFVLDMIFSQQVATENIALCGKALFSLMCCARDSYIQIVQHILQSLSDASNAERLSKEFSELTQNVDLVYSRIAQTKFGVKFDKFIVHIGFMFTN